MRISDDRVLGTIARLSGNPDFKVFMEHVVRVVHEEALEACVTDENPARAQGRAQVMQELITTVEQSRTTHAQRSAHTPNMANSL